MDFFLQNPALVSIGALLLALPLVWWLARRPSAARAATAEGDRLDTLAGWPPEPTRIMRPSERIAFSTLRMALPGYLVLAQVPVSRFISVPRRNSHVEWMRRIGSQCVDFLICDVTSKVIAVVEVMPPADQATDRLRARSERLERTLGAAGIKLHTWSEDRLPSIEGARLKIVPNAPAIPSDMKRRAVFASVTPETAMAAGMPAAAATGAGLAMADAIDVPDSFGDPTPGAAASFADTAPAPTADFSPTLPADGEPDWAQGGEVIEVHEPRATWFDDMEVTAELPPIDKR